MENEQNWLEQEEKDLGNEQANFERLPALKFVENHIVEIEIDFTQPFQKYTTTNQKGQPITKAIIPVKLGNAKQNWWLNIKNPIYREVIKLGKEGVTKFKILQTGTQANTKYVLVK